MYNVIIGLCDETIPMWYIFPHKDVKATNGTTLPLLWHCQSYKKCAYKCAMVQYYGQYTLTCNEIDMFAEM